MEQSPQFALIFDVDGTLIDSNPSHKEAYKQFFKNHDITISDDDFEQFISGRMDPDIMKHFFGEDITPEQIDAYTNEKETLYQKIYAPKIKPIDGLLPFLQQVKEAGIPMAIATSGPKMNVDFLFEHIPLQPFFAQIVCSQDIQDGKPAPQIFEVAAQKLGQSADQCIVFEDSPPGVEAAKKAGMRIVALTTSLSPDELKAANLVINNYEDVNVDKLKKVMED